LHFGRRSGEADVRQAATHACDDPRTCRAGKLTEADRARCVLWPDDWDGTPGEWALMMDKNTTPEDRRRDAAGSARRAHAAAMADPILAAFDAKNGFGRFPVDSL